MRNAAAALQRSNAAFYVSVLWQKGTGLHTAANLHHSRGFAVSYVRIYCPLVVEGHRCSCRDNSAAGVMLHFLHDYMGWDRSICGKGDTGVHTAGTPRRWAWWVLHVHALVLTLVQQKECSCACCRNPKAVGMWSFELARLVPAYLWHMGCFHQLAAWPSAHMWPSIIERADVSLNLHCSKSCKNSPHSAPPEHTDLRANPRDPTPR